MTSVGEIPKLSVFSREILRRVRELFIALNMKSKLAQKLLPHHTCYRYIHHDIIVIKFSDCFCCQIENRDGSWFTD